MGFDDDFVPEVALVTGGRGFVARHMVLQLLEKTEYIVRIMDLPPDIQLTEEERSGFLGSAVNDGRAHYVQADLRDKAKVLEAVKGVSSVFHMAAPDSSINKFQLHYDVSVTGTRNIVDACIEHEVKRLIYTSSPSVVFDGFHPIVNIDESFPIPEKHNDFYSEAKAQAEAVVLSSNGRNGLLTCAIRPSGIFGPGDKLAIPAAIAAARSGKLKFIIGDGENLFDWTYVENVANAHFCADNALQIPGDVRGEIVAAGKAYFITNGEPHRFWDFFTLVLEGLGYPSPKYCLPVKLLMPFAYMVDWTCKQLAPFGVPPSQFTPTRLRIMSTPRTFNISRARKLLGYSPPVPFEEGVRRTVESFSHLRADSPVESRARSGPSKIRNILGDETVADVILWSDTKQTLTVLSGLSFITYLFFVSGYTVISLLANFAYMGLFVLFLYSKLPDSVLGVEVPRIPPLSAFQISEESATHTALIVMSLWNIVAETISSLQKGASWAQFSKLLTVLQVMKFMGGFSLQTQATLGLLIAFSLPYFYDQHEDKVDQCVAHLRKTLDQYRTLVLSKLPPAVRKYLHN